MYPFNLWNAYRKTLFRHSFLFIYSIFVSLLIFMIVCRVWCEIFAIFSPVLVAEAHRMNGRKMERERDPKESIVCGCFSSSRWWQKPPISKGLFCQRVWICDIRKGLLNFSQKLTEAIIRNAMGMVVHLASPPSLELPSSISKVNSTFAAD